MAEACKQLGECIGKVFMCFLLDKSAEGDLQGSIEQLKRVASFAEMISGSLRGETSENLADLVESEMIAMDKAIEEAANRIQVFENYIWFNSFLA